MDDENGGTVGWMQPVARQVSKMVRPVGDRDEVPGKVHGEIRSEVPERPAEKYAHLEGLLRKVLLPRECSCGGGPYEVQSLSRRATRSLSPSLKTFARRSFASGVRPIDASWSATG